MTRAPPPAVLSDVNLTLRRGTVTALVGRSGAGKSTVAALLSRFYSPQRGAILLGEAEAGSFTRGEWARAIAMVSQASTLREPAGGRAGTKHA
jgi:ATP-binding cassette subfamily B (MDR/TAP) protein 8